MSADAKKNGKEALIAVVSDADVSAWIKTYCVQNDIADPSITLTDKTLTDAPAIVNGGASIVIVQAGEATADELERLEQLCAYVSSGGSFIVILDNPSTDAVRRLFRAGVTDVLPTPVAQNELIAALQTAHSESNLQAPSASSGKVISVLKTAGGTGATTVAVNLVREMAHLGVKRAAVVDLDIQFGGVGLALDLQPRMNITDAIRAGARLDATLLKSVIARHRGEFDVLAAPPSLTPLSVIDGAFIDSLFHHLKTIYDVVIVDTPMAWRQWMSNLVEASDLVAPVVQTSVRSADGARRIEQALKDMDIDNAPFFVIANKVEKLPTTRDRIKNLSDILGTPPEAIIRRDDKIAAEAADVGKSFRDVSASSSATQDFASAAKKITMRLGVPVDDNVSEAGKRNLRIGNFSILGGKS